MPPAPPMESLERMILALAGDIRRLARGLGIDMHSQPLLPALDLSVSSSWPGGSITAPVGVGEPIAGLFLPAGQIWSGGGLPVYDCAIVQFDAPVTVNALDITAPSADYRPELIGLDHADHPAGPWTPLLTHDVGDIVATQRVACLPTTASCWQISVTARETFVPAVFAIQLHGLPA